MEFGSVSWAVGSGAIAALLGVGGAIRSAIVELRATRLQVFGVPHKTSELLRGIVVSFIIVFGGIAAIDAGRHDVPLWASIVMPIVALLFAMSVMLGQLAARDTFSWERFGKVIFAPAVASLTPAATVAWQHFPEVLT